VLLAQVLRVSCPIKRKLLLEQVLGNLLSFLSQSEDLVIKRIPLNSALRVHRYDFLFFDHTTLLESNLILLVRLTWCIAARTGLQGHVLVDATRVEMTDGAGAATAWDWGSPILGDVSLQGVIQFRGFLEERDEKLECDHAEEGVGGKEREATVLDLL